MLSSCGTGNQKETTWGRANSVKSTAVLQASKPQREVLSPRAFAGGTSTGAAAAGACSTDLQVGAVGGNGEQRPKAQLQGLRVGGGWHAAAHGGVAGLHTDRLACRQAGGQR